MIALSHSLPALLPRILRIAACAGIVVLASPACAQGGADGAAPRDAGSAGEVNRDSVVARANQSRIKGAETAPVTIVEVSDFQCPFCRQFATETFSRLDSVYVQTGKVRFIFVNLPLPNHGNAWPAAEAAMCAGAQGAFWPMHDLIFAAQEEWTGMSNAGALFAAMASRLRLDEAAFGECVAKDYVAPLLVGDLIQASQSGFTGTPSFIFNGNEAVAGALPFEEFERRIEALLAGGGGSQP